MAINGANDVPAIGRKAQRGVVDKPGRDVAVNGDAVVVAEAITEKIFARYLYEPKMSDVDLFLRSSGEMRTSNFLPWQSVYAEMVFMDVLWPDVDRRILWRAVEEYSMRQRRFGTV